MKIIEEELISFRISKEYKIDIGNNKILTINKWLYEDTLEMDFDFEFDEKSQEIFNKLPKDKRFEIIDYIDDNIDVTKTKKKHE